MKSGHNLLIFNRFRSRIKIGLFLLFGFVLLGLGFQNCSGFRMTESELSKNSNYSNAKMMELSLIAGSIGGDGNIDGNGTNARFNNPNGITADSSGNLFVSDSSNNTIRKIDPQGNVTTIAGLAGTWGSADGNGANARFNCPNSITTDSSGNLFVAERCNSTIRKVDPQGNVTTIAGLAGTAGSDDGVGANARFKHPHGIAIDSTGNLFVADYYNSTIRKIDPQGNVTTVAGLAGTTGSDNGVGALARFNLPSGITADSFGNLFVSDSNNDTIRKIDLQGNVTTIAGLVGNHGSSDGNGANARFSGPIGIAVDTSGNLFLADTRNSTIRKVDPQGNVTTIAGLAGTYGSDDGVGANARFNGLSGITADSSGNLFVADSDNRTIRKIDPQGNVSTIAGLAGTPGSADENGANARFYKPFGIAADSSGNLFVADRNNNTIRKVDPQGNVTTIAGSANTSGSSDGAGANARFNDPTGIVVDSSGNLYVTESNNHTIRKIDPQGNVTTIAGLVDTWNYVDGAGAEARFYAPSGITADFSGNLFVTDSDNYAIRRIDTQGNVTTTAGHAGSYGFADDVGTKARFNYPYGITADSSGNLLVADSENYSIRKINPQGNVTTIFGAPNKKGFSLGPKGSLGYTKGIAYLPDGSFAIISDRAVFLLQLNP